MESSPTTLFASNVTSNLRWNPTRSTFRIYLESDHLAPISLLLASYKTPYFLTVSLQQTLYRSSASGQISLHSILKHSTQSHSVNVQVILLIEILQWLPISQKRINILTMRSMALRYLILKKKKSNISKLKVVLICSPKQSRFKLVKFFDNSKLFMSVKDS